MNLVFMNDVNQRLITSKALKYFAANASLRELFISSKEFQDFLRPAAHRYIVGENISELFERLQNLASIGYNTGIEFAGEEASSIAEVDTIVNEYLNLIDRIDNGVDSKPQLGFDLSNLGSGISKEIAILNCEKICEKAIKKDIPIIISMERSKWTDIILDIFFMLRKKFSNLGITLQAQLNRTKDDIKDVLKTGCKIRLVKGVYDEPEKISLPRGSKLDKRYMEILIEIANNENIFAYATQDPKLIEMIRGEGIHKTGEHEMLHGVRPELLKSTRDLSVIKPRIACVYGYNWYLHFIHRLAESPENIYQAFNDIYLNGKIKKSYNY
ncbi:proline dehydrogenase family protein [Xenorhabdus miraniensis]|uniref:Proline dehydrogenase 2 n=1 Tax=Xenorhabdus miraniensis TaxID=351674 RepID=A0A2D0JRL3_9GAMM|nr:proline dehydrogenase family protein [Xenorhabdus miraniensis]PHM48648.1 Proline dehydrogenase 2 [Xenorhabdus miraniensis]PHM48981.1 Proline dehydrogenase 2 [Xenorhabdus miraniensis]